MPQSLAYELPKSNPAISTGPPQARPAHVQEALAASVYSFILREQLILDERDAQRIEDRYHLPASLQRTLGYASAPRPRRTIERDERTSQMLDALSDDAFLDWFTYSKAPLYVERRGETDPASDYSEIEDAIFEKFGPLSGISGLYNDDGRARLKTFPTGTAIVPCRVGGVIRAIQVYPCPGRGRFFWYSTQSARGGAGLRSSLHIANEHRAARSGVALLVSHTIAADAEAWACNECTVAINNISSLRLPYVLRATLPDIRAVAVSSTLGEMTARTLRENGFDVEMAGSEAGDE